MKKQLLCLVIILGCVISASARQKPTQRTNGPEKDVDPLALRVLKAATDPIRGAKNFSFRALVSREHLGTNGQIVTLFHLSDVTVERPDKLRVNFHGRGKEVQLFCDAGRCTLYTPSEKLYASIKAPETLDRMMDALAKRDVYMPIRNFLQSDPYQSLSNDLTTGYVVGRVTLFDQTVHQLAFTEPKAEWQLWVIGGDKPLVRRLQVVDKSTSDHLRITVDFLDWNFNVTPSSDTFVFHKPADAKEIQILKESAESEP